MIKQAKTTVLNTYLEVRDATITVLKNVYYLVGGVSLLALGAYGVAQGRDRIAEVLGGLGLVMAGCFAVVIGIVLLAQLLTKRG